MIRPLTPTERAAQIWCRPEFSGDEMDSVMCHAIAVAIHEAVLEERERCAKIAEKHEEGCGRDPQEPCAGAIAVQIREAF